MEKEGHYVQYFLQLVSCLWFQVKVRASQVAFKCLICSASRDESFVQRGMRCVPSEEVLAVATQCQH